MISAVRTSFHEQSVQFYNANKKNIRHIKKAVLFSLGAAQVVGAIAATTAAVALLYNAVMTLGCLRQKDKLINQLYALRDNALQLSSSLVSMVPLVGVVAAGLLDAHNAKSPTLFSRATESYSKNVLGRLPFAKTLLLKAMYPLSGIKYESSMRPPAYHAGYKMLEATPLKIAVDRLDGKKHTIHTDFINTNSNLGAKTMILFPGNGMMGSDMLEEAAFYKKEGWNVLMMTFGGYPKSDEGIKTTEATTIQDVNAILRQLDAQGVAKIGLHGFSKGGSVAMHATQLSNKIAYVCLNMTYTSVASVAANLIKNLRKEMSILKYVPTAVVRGVAERSLVAGRRVLGVKDRQGNPYHTDNCNSLEKAKKYKGVFVTIGGTEDFLMGRNPKNGSFQENFSIDLFKAHIAANPEAKGKTAFAGLIPSEHSSGIDITQDFLRKALKAV